MEQTLAFLFGGQTKAKILEVLLSHPEDSYHLRGLAQVAGTDSGNTSKLLRNLVKMGLVTATPDSHSTRYKINDRSPLTAPLRELIASAGSLTSDLRKVAEALSAEYVAIFGSVASGTDDKDSDVDILVVGEIGAIDAQIAFKAIARKHHRAINTVVVAKPELNAYLAEGRAFWQSIVAGKRVDLKGNLQDVTVSQTTARRSQGVSSVRS